MIKLRKTKMPTYEYVCTSCEHEWEEDQSIKDAAIKVCPECKEETAKRLISGGSGFILSGNCWSKDGYGKK
jgi:putative FmdB family regulatory protein